MSIEPNPVPTFPSNAAAGGADAGRAPLDADALRRVLGGLGAGELWISQRTGSTNDDLAARAQEAPLANLSVETTEHQMAGHGRLGRDWQTPERSALATSIYFRPAPGFDQSGLAWLSMLCATAMVQTLREDAGLAAGLKWPNDVVAGGKKVCGVLAQLVMTGQGPVVIVGAGLNVSLTADELPVDTAASLATLGAGTLDRTLLLGGYLRRVVHLFRSFEQAGGNAAARTGYAPVPSEAGAGAEAAPSTLRELVRSVMVTIGHEVDAHLPNGTVLRGTAIDLDAEGSLSVRDAGGKVHSVLAGDVYHLRRSDGSYA
ncbi:biotin--[acetyl-CoA-carboxylase] ligase [Paeniglutamicibacter sp.]|uniref:biotin--[acetyl-CoA-carboxylase] ligase n=1 Tax=Paeniglutamicibacter sp. TaxID=1934391 RepID=UPI003989EC6E